MWPIKTCLFFLGFVGACALSLVHPIVGIANYMMVYQINPDKMWWGQPLVPLDIRYSLTAAVCLILGMILSGGRVPSSRAFFGTWLLLLFLFTIIVLASNWVGVGSTDYGVQLMDKMVKMTIFVVCLVRMGATRRNFKIILWTLVIGTLMIGNDAYHAPADDFFSGRLNFVGGADFRDSSGLAAHIAAMLPLLGVVALTTPAWRGKAVAMLAGVLAVNTIVQCRTRSAFVGLLAGGVVAFLMVPRTRRTRIYAALIVATFGAYALTDDNFWHRMNTVLHADKYASDSTIQSRMELWKVAGVMFLEHPFGVGVGQFREVLSDYNSEELPHAFRQVRRVTHNSYLLCATELGVHGIIVFLTLIIVAFLKLRRCALLAGRTDHPAESKLLTYGCLLSMVVYLAAGAFTDRLYTESYWWVLALPICLERAVAREVAAREPTPELAHEWSNIDVVGALQKTTSPGDARRALG